MIAPQRLYKFALSIFVSFLLHQPNKINAQADTSLNRMYWDKKIEMNVDYQTSVISFNKNDTVYFSLINKGTSRHYTSGDSFFLFIENDDYVLFDVMKYYLYQDFNQGDTLYYRLIYPCLSCVKDDSGKIANYPELIRLSDVISVAKTTESEVKEMNLNRKYIKLAFTESIASKIEVLSNKCAKGFNLFIDNSLSNNSLNFNMCNEVIGVLPWRITNARGEVVASGSIEKSEIKQDFLISFDAQPRGYYTLIIGHRSDIFTSTFKVTW